ncbi:MAG: type I-E CRISPR-associated protein Cse2/CasB [Gammaproteobacteria bacterium]|jgi:CRISPR system Cascade subunit CasB|nr:type I-E CRISPR-associated protein Cse2/CasB [Gammaproteobacteria bacterium]
MSEKISFRQNTAIGKALMHWWSNLENDRATRAELKRAHDLNSIVLTGAFQRFYRYMLASGWPEASTANQNDRLAVIAGLLALAKKHDERSLPEAMSIGEKPSVSELRFRRLLESSTIDELFVGLRRALPLIENQTNIYELANDVIYWGDHVKKRWAFNYHWPQKQK